MIKVISPPINFIKKADMPKSVSGLELEEDFGVVQMRKRRRKLSSRCLGRRSGQQGAHGGKLQ